MKDFLWLSLLVVGPTLLVLGAYNMAMDNICSKRAKMEGYSEYTVVNARCYGTFDGKQWNYIFK